MNFVLVLYKMINSDSKYPKKQPDKLKHYLSTSF